MLDVQSNQPLLYSLLNKNQRSPPRYPPNAATLHGCPREVSGATAGGSAASLELGWGSYACCQRPPRTSILARVLVAMIATLCFIQALSCGMFFCVQVVPFGHLPYIDYRDLVVDASSSRLLGRSGASVPATHMPWQVSGADVGGVPGSSLPSSRALGRMPQLIPRIIHQTFRTKRLPMAAKVLMRSWHEQNGYAWQVRFFDDAACSNFVRREFPEYLEAYLALPDDMERASFFKYMVLLRLGGVYADVDVECRQPIDRVILPTDTLVLGWDAEAPTDKGAVAQHMARRRQLLGWFMAAAPGHPVLRAACEHIAHNALTRFSNDSRRDAAERTGTGMLTDLVMGHVERHTAGKQDDPWTVRVLPRVAFGVRTGEFGSLTPDLPQIVALHHFLESWHSRRDSTTARGGWARAPPIHRRMLAALGWHRGLAETEPEEEDQALPRTATDLFPVSAMFDPPFTIMTNLVGAGDPQAGADVSEQISAWGTWQPALAATRRPAVAEALVGALGGKHSVARGILVDVGAGHGFVTLAAAARGHRVIAFEASEGSLAALHASIAYNGFGALITVRTASVGAEAGFSCIAPRGVAALAAQQRRQGRLLVAGQQHSISINNSITHRALASSKAAQSTRTQAQERTIEQDAVNTEEREAEARVQRGYAHAEDLTATDAGDGRWHDAAGAAHRTAPGSGLAAGGSCAGRTVRRVSLSEELEKESHVAVVRISAHGHEGWVVEGLLPYLQSGHRADVVYLEFSPQAMRAAGYQDPLRPLRALYDLGYTSVVHAGAVCDRRWLNVTGALRAQGLYGPTAQRALIQPTWCKLQPEAFALLEAHTLPGVPENVLLLHGKAGLAGAATRPLPDPPSAGQREGQPRQHRPAVPERPSVVHNLPQPSELGPLLALSPTPVHPQPLAQGTGSSSAREAVLQQHQEGLQQALQPEKHLELPHRVQQAGEVPVVGRVKDPPGASPKAEPPSGEAAGAANSLDTAGALHAHAGGAPKAGTGNAQHHSGALAQVDNSSHSATLWGPHTTAGRMMLAHAGPPVIGPSGGGGQELPVPVHQAQARQQQHQRWQLQRHLARLLWGWRH